jgi:uncharacterized protein YqgC (DUF456 family)
MFFLWAVLAIVLVLLGVAGCVLPALPGPPLAWVGLFVVWAARGFEPRAMGEAVPWILLGATVLVTAIDVLLPFVGAKRYGATKAGMWGSVVGMLAGMIWFPPFGLIVGTLVGAFAGEWIRGRASGESAKAAWGVFVGTMVGIGLKLAVCGAIAWFVVAETLAGA